MKAIQKLWCRTYQTVQGLASWAIRWHSAEIVNGTSYIPALLKAHGAQKAFVATGPRLFASGTARCVTGPLEAAGFEYAEFHDIESDPSNATVENMVSLYTAKHCDCFIAIGGGSIMDAAKGAAARIARPDRQLDELAGMFKVRKKMPLFIAIPTTAGTGSETTIAAVITDREQQRKYALCDPALMPDYAVLDPQLTYGLPPAITAQTGMDALTHAVEAYISVHGNTKETRALALEAVKVIFAELERAYKNGRNESSRAKLLLASYKAGYAFTRVGVGYVHAAAHTLGGLYHTPHGLANAVILPVMLEEYGESVHMRLAELADAAGVSKPGMTAAEGAGAFIRGIRSMNSRMGIPCGFDFIKDEDLPLMTARALREGNPFYPVPKLFGEKEMASAIARIRI